jgi:hypothetical protein
MIRTGTYKYLSAALVIPLLSACNLTSTSTTAGTDNPTLNTANDDDLFAGNTVKKELNHEVKRQFLTAVSKSGIIRQLAGTNANILLQEIGITKAETTTLTIQVAGGAAKESASVGLGDKCEGVWGTGNLEACYSIAQSKYNITFDFQEKVSSPTEGEIIHLPLKVPLQIEEMMTVRSRVKLSFDAIAILPTPVKTIVARFFDQISLSVDSGMTYKRESELSTRMFYRSKATGNTVLLSTVWSRISWVFPFALLR